MKVKFDKNKEGNTVESKLYYPDIDSMVSLLKVKYHAVQECPSGSNGEKK